MRILLLITTVALSNATFADDWQPPDSSWQSLFNGKDFTGWKQPDAEHNWQDRKSVV